MVMSKSSDATVPCKPEYKSSSDGQRQGAIGHYASRMTAAFIRSGHIDSPEDAVKLFNDIVAGLDNSFYK